MGGNSLCYGFTPSIQEWLLWQIKKFSPDELNFLLSEVEEWKNYLQIIDMEEVSFMDLLIELIDEESYMEERSNPNFEELIRLGLNITWYSVKNTMPDYELFIINDCSAHI